METIMLICLIQLLLFQTCVGRAIRHEPVTDWNKVSQSELDRALKVHPRWQKAKNVILLMGDGMGFTTTTASRLYNAQKEGKTFQEIRHSFDNFPYVGISLTYSANTMVADSAAAANAFLCGEKTNWDTTGVNQNVLKGQCEKVKGNELTSILKHSYNAGKWTGIVTTASVTDASPSSAYAHSANRYWESDADIPAETKKRCHTKDIARQLVEDNNFINVVLGGGREKFLPNTMNDPEYPTKQGKRQDNRNLIEEWKRNMALKFTQKEKYALVQKLGEFNDVSIEEVEHLFGLFEPYDMHYEVDRTNRTKNPWAEPSLAEMTEKAINILKKSDQGYFLFVEGNNIDSGHHANNAFRALDDTVAFSQAVQRAVEMTDEEDTLILVTADHSHPFTIGGLNSHNSDVLGLATLMHNETESVDYLGEDGLPFTILSYGNGPGFYYHHNQSASPAGYRRNLTEERDTGKIANIDYQQESPVPLPVDTHGGEDVPVYGRGPLAHLVSGTHEQSYIAHLMMYASCVGPSTGIRTFCRDDTGRNDMAEEFIGFK